MINFKCMLKLLKNCLLFNKFVNKKKSCFKALEISLKSKDLEFTTSTPRFARSIINDTRAMR